MWIFIDGHFNTILELNKMKFKKLLEGLKQKFAHTDPKANYFGPERGPFKCGNCKFFISPSDCHLVESPVDAEGCCNLFQTKQ